VRGAQHMGVSYLTNRMGLVAELLAWADRLRLPEEVAHDAVLLMDRFMSTETQARGAGGRARSGPARHAALLLQARGLRRVGGGAGAPGGRMARVPCEGLPLICCSAAVLCACMEAEESRGAGKV